MTPMKMLPTRWMAMFGLVLVSSLASPAHAESKLTTEVFTASPQGFLVTSTLIAGEKDAVLVDGQLTLSDAHRLVGLILDSKKTLTTVYVTHAHPDHYFGLVVVKQAFPKVKIVALPATVAEIKKTWAAKVKQWGPMFGANLATKPVIPEAARGQLADARGPDARDPRARSGRRRRQLLRLDPFDQDRRHRRHRLPGDLPVDGRDERRLARRVEQDAGRDRGPGRDRR